MEFDYLLYSKVSPHWTLIQNGVAMPHSLWWGLGGEAVTFGETLPGGGFHRPGAAEWAYLQLDMQMGSPVREDAHRPLGRPFEAVSHEPALDGAPDDAHRPELIRTGVIRTGLIGRCNRKV